MTASSLTTRPRPMLMKKALGFMRANFESSKRPRVSGVSGAQTATKSDCGEEVVQALGPHSSSTSGGRSVRRGSTAMMRSPCGAARWATP